MEVLKSLINIPGEKKISLIIGNFDGVHVGHQSILNFISDAAKKDDELFVVMTFIPHPRKILYPEEAHFLINTYEDRRSFLEKAGVDYIIEIDFTRDFSTQDPDDFIQKYILPQPNVSHFYVGYDFSFGSNKSGDSDLLNQYADSFKVINLREFKSQQAKVSSSVLRENISNGKMADVSKLLGRDFFLTGRIVKGQGRGRTIGFPTANMLYSNDIIIPATGVYITKTCIKDLTYYSLTNIGKNPTFETSNELNVETHILDFDLDIYGESISVLFLKKIRDEIKFESANQLIEQIDKDKQVAIEYFKNA